MSKKPEDIEIEGEFVILFDTPDDENDWSGFVKAASELARSHGLRLREYGTEKQMRNSLLSRAQYIVDTYKEEE